MAQKLQRSTFCDEIVSALKDEILSGKRQPGEKLPSERELAEEYGVSRAPVREALRSLSQLGLVTIRHGSGVFVNEFRSDTMLRFFADSVKQRNLVEVVELRKILEVSAAELAAQRATPQDIKDLERLKERVREKALQFLETGNGEGLSQADMDYHLAVAKATQNSTFAQFFYMVRDVLRVHQMHAARDPRRLESTLKYHDQLFAAIAAHDPSRASKYMRQHIESIEEALVESIMKDLAYDHHGNGKAK